MSEIDKNPEHQLPARFRLDAVANDLIDSGWQQLEAATDCSRMPENQKGLFCYFETKGIIPVHIGGSDWVRIQSMAKQGQLADFHTWIRFELYNNDSPYGEPHIAEEDLEILDAAGINVSKYAVPHMCYELLLSPESSPLVSNEWVRDRWLRKHGKTQHQQWDMFHELRDAGVIRELSDDQCEQFMRQLLDCEINMERMEEYVREYSKK